MRLGRPKKPRARPRANAATRAKPQLTGLASDVKFEFRNLPARRYAVISIMNVRVETAEGFFNPLEIEAVCVENDQRTISCRIIY